MSMKVLPEKAQLEGGGYLLRCYSPEGIKEDDEEASQEQHSLLSAFWLAMKQAAPFHYTLPWL